jgi:16S rRNA (adenine(1408)-N(1))-methyltransferase
MEILRGKHASFMDAPALAERLIGYETLHIDIGTGDGRFVEHMARANPGQFVIGMDACRENLQTASRRAPSNALFVIANAQALPSELDGLASHITINFPWGSLLEGLLTGDVDLARLARPDTTLEVRLIGGALAEAGWSLEKGAEQIQAMLESNGFMMRPMQPMLTDALKVFPTTWAKRIAFGRDPRAVCLCGEIILEEYGKRGREESRPYGENIRDFVIER